MIITGTMVTAIFGGVGTSPSISITSIVLEMNGSQQLDKVLYY